MSRLVKNQILNQRKSFIIKQKSLSSLRSKAFSVAQLSDKKQKLFKTHRSTIKVQQQSQIQRKNDQITLLKRKLETALNLALNNKMISSQKKQKIFQDQKTKAWFQNKIRQLQKLILKEREDFKILEKQHNQTHLRLNQTEQCFKNKSQQCSYLKQKVHETQQMSKQITRLMLLLKDQLPLKQRIKTLQQQLRIQRLKVTDTSSNLKSIQKQRQKLLQQLRLQKPKQQQLKQNIAYLQRVNLDLSRKMQDYDRRQNEYIRQANMNKKSIKLLSEQKANLQENLSSTTSKLMIKIQQCQNLQAEVKQLKQDIINLQVSLQKERENIKNLNQELISTKQFYKTQQKQNSQLKKRNIHLLQHQSQYQRVLTHFQKVNDEINLTIIARNQQITKLNGIISHLSKHSQKIQQKFMKFQVLFQDRNQKGDNEIIEFFYTYIRENSKLHMNIKQLKAQMEEKVLMFGEQRDNLIKKSQVRRTSSPSQQSLFANLYHQKNQQLLLLQGSNDQLIKIKKQLENNVQQLQNQLEQEKKQSIALKLKAAEVFRAKKQVQQARKTITRYQQMIEQQNQNIKDYQSQLIVLRNKITQLNQKNFQLDLDNKNYIVKIKQFQDIMVQLNADVLIDKKNKNDKNAHMINDSLDKLQNGVKSLSFFFTCCFCGQMPPNPVTLSPCGHTYCQKQKCKQAYSQFCYQCDTGMPIQNRFTNKFMKQAMGKYKFFKILIDQTTDNVKILLKKL